MADRIIQIQDGAIISDTQNQKAQTVAHTISKKEKAAPKTIRIGPFIEAFKMAWRAMITHRLRTLLTTLGIIIGIASVVLIVAIGNGATNNLLANINEQGVNNVFIYPQESKEEGGQSIEKSLLSLADVNVLSQQHFVDSISPEVRSINETLRYNDNVVAKIKITGVNEQYFRMFNIELSQGVPFQANDMSRRSPIAIINHNTCKKLFPHQINPIGKIIFINSIPCKIVGVIKPKKSETNYQESIVLVPYSTLMAHLGPDETLLSITLRVRHDFSVKTANKIITKLLTKSHHRKDFGVLTTEAMGETFQEIAGLLTFVIASIAFISLIVGGIGVMNIMLVSVSERTREIGIRMAVGGKAKRHFETIFD